MSVAMNDAQRRRRQFFFVAWIACALIVANAALAGADPGDGSDLAHKWEWTDVGGQKHSPFTNPKTKAIVLVFVSTDCPIANAFQPYLREFEQKYSGRGVSSFVVYSSTQLEEPRIVKHQRDYQIRMPAIHDKDQRLGKQVEAKVTPEAIVIDRQGNVRYRGLISNLYVGFGKKRAVPNRFYLSDACDAVLAGERVKTPVTKPIGCFIYYADERGSE